MTPLKYAESSTVSGCAAVIAAGAGAAGAVVEGAGEGGANAARALGAPGMVSPDGGGGPPRYSTYK